MGFFFELTRLELLTFLCKSEYKKLCFETPISLSDLILKPLYCGLLQATQTTLTESVWSDWGSYGDCSRPCGGGLANKTRTCLGATHTCTGSDIRYRICNREVRLQLLAPLKLQRPLKHTGQCKRTGGCYNELVVAFFSTGGGVKGKKSIPVDFMIYL